MSSQRQGRGSPFRLVTWKRFASYQADVKPSRGCFFNWQILLGHIIECWHAEVILKQTWRWLVNIMWKSEKHERRRGAPVGWGALGGILNPPAFIVIKVNTLNSHIIQMNSLSRRQNCLQTFYSLTLQRGETLLKEGSRTRFIMEECWQQLDKGGGGRETVVLEMYIWNSAL